MTSIECISPKNFGTHVLACNFSNIICLLVSCFILTFFPRGFEVARNDLCVLLMAPRLKQWERNGLLAWKKYTYSLLCDDFGCPKKSRRGKCKINCKTFFKEIRNSALNSSKPWIQFQKQFYF